ncbi:hypothetical protein MHH70_04040 [Metasolibacillus sp. FSL H7-0170]|uniref:hypothetical protein n=1 Tax=Metasolibacillus sp. FSL H7-0170 TaxID=2921431 RepID=UPI0031583A1B
MKIISNSNKLVNSLSKLLAKLKEGGQKVAEKAAAKAAELKAQANAMMAQAKQGMRESMDNVGRALRGNEPQLAMAGANGAKAGTVKNSDSIVQMSRGESVGSGGSAKGKDNLKYDDRVLKRMKEDAGTHHNFPTSFDKTILSNKPSIVRPDGRAEYLHTGTINGQQGVYHITLKDGVVTHRSFIPQSDWKRYSNRWELPSQVTP